MKTKALKNSNIINSKIGYCVCVWRLICVIDSYLQDKQLFVFMMLYQVIKFLFKILNIYQSLKTSSLMLRAGNFFFSWDIFSTVSQGFI